MAALAALVIAVQLMSSDRLRPAALLLAPIVVVMSKIIGLYDRDELLLRKTTLEEAPVLFQLATLYAVGVALLAAIVVDGTIGSRQLVALWALLFLLALLGRAAARATVDRVVPAERCLLVGNAPTRTQSLRDFRGAASMRRSWVA